jgi:3-hydroxyacyl-CoA dehydrogenase
MKMKIEKVTVYGTGLIGNGWTTHLLCKGITNVMIYLRYEKKIQKSIAEISKNLEFMVHEGMIAESGKEYFLSCLRYTTDVREAVRDADLIIENGPEDLESKRSMIAEIEKYCRDDAIITSSTSGILISEIAKYASHPERIIGAHPYHPVYLLPLIEIVKGDKLDPRYLDGLLDFCRQIDKKPVVLKKESPGYIASHLMTVLLRECVNLVVSGVCDMEDVDTAFTFGPGMRYALMGPYTVLQLAGGESGLAGVLCGPIGKSAEDWMKSFSNWTEWPPEALEFFQSCQTEMDRIISGQDGIHGRNNEELERFRDHGLLHILQLHGLA